MDLRLTVSQKLIVNAFKKNAKANRGSGTDPKTLTLCSPQNVSLHSGTLKPNEIFSPTFFQTPNDPKLCHPSSS